MKDYTDFQIERLEDLYRNFKNAAFEDINHEFPRLFKELRNVSVFDSILSELKTNYPISQKELNEWNQKRWAESENKFLANYSLDRYVSILLHWCDYLLDSGFSYKATNLGKLSTSGVENESENTKEQNYFKECIVGKIVSFIKKQLKEVHYSLYLLNRYKMRSEVFKKDELNEIYRNNSKDSETVLQDDLRLFLFEQGVGYPFSCAELKVGKTDVYAEVSPDDYMLTEVKIFDADRKYGINRLNDGFSQLVQYVNELQVPIGYLIVFNFDNSLPVVVTETEDNVIVLDDKIYHIIFINLYNAESASKHRCRIIACKEGDLKKGFKYDE